MKLDGKNHHTTKQLTTRLNASHIIVLGRGLLLVSFLMQSQIGSGSIGPVTAFHTASKRFVARMFSHMNSQGTGSRETFPTTCTEDL